MFFKSETPYFDSSIKRKNIMKTSVKIKAQIIEEFELMSGDEETHPISIMKMCIKEIFAQNGINKFSTEMAEFSWKEAQSNASSEYMKSKFGK